MVADITAVHYRLDDLTTGNPLPKSFDRGWVELLNDDGNGSISFQNADPALADIVGDGQDLIAFNVSPGGPTPGIAWTAISALTTGDSLYPGGATDGTYVYAVLFGAGVVSLARYDPGTNTWSSSLADPPTSTAGLVLAYDSGFLYLIGDDTDTYRYNIGTDTWDTVAPIPTAGGPRSSLTAAVHAGNIYCAGGYEGVTETDALSIYTIATDTWSAGAPLPVGLGDVQGAFVDGIMYVGGGWEAGTEAYVNHWLAYNPVIDTWTELDPPGDITTDEAAPFVGARSDGLILVGGGFADAQSDHFWLYNPTTDTFTRVDDATQVGCSAGAVIGDVAYIAKVFTNPNPPAVETSDLAPSPHFTIHVPRSDRMAKDPGGAVNEVTTRSGNGLFSLLDGLRQYPALGVGRKPKETDRYWDSSNPNGFDDSSWGAPEILGTVDYGRAVWDIQWPLIYLFEQDGIWAPGFIDGGAHMLWAVDGTLLDGQPDPAESGGKVPARQWVTAPADGIYYFYLLGDDNTQARMDGQDLASTQGWGTFAFSSATIELTAGDHLVWTLTTNRQDAELSAWLTSLGITPPSPLVNPGYWAWSLHPDAGGKPNPTPIAHSDGAEALTPGYADPLPGMNPGEIMLTQLDEVTARGASVADDFDCTFDLVNDSNGDPWDTATNYVSKTGSSIRDSWVELAQTYIDLRLSLDPLSGKIKVDAYNKGGLGTARSITFGDAGKRYTKLQQTRDETITNVALVETQDTWYEVVNTGSVDDLRRFEGRLSFGANGSRPGPPGSGTDTAEIDRVIGDQLVLTADPREEVTLAHEVALAAYRDYDLGDTGLTTELSDGSSADERCVGITVTEDRATGVAYMAPTLKDVVLEAEERTANMERIMLQGV